MLGAMSNPTALIDYATDGLDHPADRLFRRIVAWFAIVNDSAALISTALHVALANGWAASPSSMAWEFDSGWNVALTGAQTLFNSIMVLAGVLLLKRSRSSVALLRVTAGCSIVLSILGLAVAMLDSPIYASYWSTPAAGGVNAMQFARGVMPDILLIFLTLPPLARRMV
jgi:hypothetical protein